MLGSEKLTNASSPPHPRRIVEVHPPSAPAPASPVSLRSDEPGTIEIRDLPYAALIEGMIEGCQVVDFDLRYVYLNPSALRHARRELSELVGKRMTDCFPGIETTELYAVLGRCLRERVDCRFENEFVFPSGLKGVFDLHIVPAPQGLLIFSVDISEMRRLSAQMRQSQKIIAIGQLAAGAAHDLANLLTVVTGGSELLLERMSPSDPNRAMAVNVRDAAERCSDMVSQILTFRKQANLRSKMIDLNRVIEEARPMLQQLVGERIEIVFHLKCISGAVNIHPTQFEQILINLAVNARDAMPEGGSLTIASSDNASTPGGAEKPDCRQDRFAQIVVTDTGQGMDEDVLSRVFEPFFTTKREGMGAGLGLTSVYGIVQEAGGTITVASAPGKGASFSISLPIFD
jgi:signal transduction histidine kinase